VATSTSTNLTTVKRTQVSPPPAFYEDDRVLRQQYLSLTQEVVTVHNLIQGFTVAGIGAGVALVAVTIPVPMKNTNYAVTVEPDWLTATSVTAKTVTGFTVNFAVVTPGAANTLMLTLIG
jgi:hypothetical protein